MLHMNDLVKCRLLENSPSRTSQILSSDPFKKLAKPKPPPSLCDYIMGERSTIPCCSMNSICSNNCRANLKNIRASIIMTAVDLGTHSSFPFHRINYSIIDYFRHLTKAYALVWLDWLFHDVSRASGVVYITHWLCASRLLATDSWTFQSYLIRWCRL